MKWLATAILVFGVPARALPCSGPAGGISPSVMVRDADVIVRAAAIEYITRPADPTVRTTGLPDSVIRFKVVETLKGPHVPAELTLNGYLSDQDDFNDQAPPYTFVRPGGRSGSCFANTYRQGAEFLLLLKGAGRSFTINWCALGPVNEQLKSAEDPWLTWVRREAKREGPQPVSDRAVRVWSLTVH